METMADVNAAMERVADQQHAVAQYLPDSALARMDDHALTMSYNARLISLAQLDAERQRRRDEATRQKWFGRTLKLDELGPCDRGELMNLGCITPEQFQRQRLREQRRAAEHHHYWMKHRRDLQSPPRTRDEELMLMDHVDLMSMKSRANRLTVNGGALDPADYTVEEIDAEFASRRVTPLDEVLKARAVVTDAQ
jgi:hypothetical protein